MHAPTVGLIVPAHDEVGYVEQLLDALTPQLAQAPGWSTVLVDDSSSDGTGHLLDMAARRIPHCEVLHVAYGSPGGARSAGATAALWTSAPDWLLTVDADVVVSPDWVAQWMATLADVDGDAAVGAVNGVEVQGHLTHHLPNAAFVGAAFGRGVTAGEAAIGVTNLNGVNHAVRASTYRTCGPYVQPTMPGPAGPVWLAGSDWDLGLRVRLAGHTIAESAASVVDRGRRFLADVRAYVSGDAYEGEFRRVIATSPPADVDERDVPELAERALERSLRHFLMKPLLAGVPLREVAEITLSTATREQVIAWAARWPHPTFHESRNGFVYGRLAHFSDRFFETIRADLGLGDVCSMVEHAG